MWQPSRPHKHTGSFAVFVRLPELSTLEARRQAEHLCGALLDRAFRGEP
jgi:hypothetical protein